MKDTEIINELNLEMSDDEREYLIKQMSCEPSEERIPPKAVSVNVQNKQEEKSVEQISVCEYIHKLIKPLGYEARNNQLYKVKMVSDNPTVMFLANFLAWINKDIKKYDGTEETAFCEVEGIYRDGTPLQRKIIPMCKLSSMSWIPECWGSKCNIAPNQSANSQIRYIMQYIGANKRQTEYIYEFTGWEKVVNKYVFLHGNGAIGADNLKVELADRLKGYTMPDDITSEQEIKGAKTSLALLDIYKSTLLPLLAMTYLSPLNEFLKQSGYEPNFIMYLVGRSGKGKTSLAMLMLSHFGSFNYMGAPLSIALDTHNSMRILTFVLKDVLTVIDDYHPSAGQSMAELDNRMQKLGRLYGDRTGGNRLNSDSTLKVQKYPRGNAIATAEQFPNIGESGLARYVAVEMLQDIDYLCKLKEAYKTRGFLVYSMVGYIKYIQQRVNSNLKAFINELKQFFYEHESRVLKHLEAHGAHSRVGSQIIWLNIGLEYMLQYFEDIRAITPEEKAILIEQGEKIFIDLGINQAQNGKSEKPVYKFITAFKELLASGGISIHDIKNACLSNGESFCGYKDELYYYLIPGIVFKEVKNLCDKKGEMFSITEKALFQQLDEMGLLETEKSDSGKRRTIKKTFAGERVRYLCLKINMLDTLFG